MTLPVSGPISASQINVELSRTATAPISLGEAAVRGLAGVASGAIGFGSLRGKAAWTPSLWPPGDAQAGSLSFKNFIIECNDAPAGSTYLWSLSNLEGGWTILSGQGTDTVTIRANGVVDFDAAVDVTCTVTKDGVSKSATGHWEYSSYTAP